MPHTFQRSRDSVVSKTRTSIRMFVSRLGKYADLSHSEDDISFLEKELLDAFTINVVGVTKTITAFLPLIKQSKIKKVISISTGMADLGKHFIAFIRGQRMLTRLADMVNQFSVAMSAPYSVSKAALNLVVAKYNAAYAAQGILFMSISPGFVDTSEGKIRKFTIVQG